MKKFLAVILALVMVLALAACAKTPEKEEGSTGEAASNNAAATPISKDLKVGFIFLHDENSTYDKNFIDAADAACEALGMDKSQFIYKKNIEENQACAEAARELIDEGCTLIFADSLNHEPFMIEVAKENPDVQFCNATGTRAHTEGLANYHNAFASIYEGRYLAGIAAGMKLNEMIKNGDFTAEEAKMGYVGAFTYAEVKSGYTSFYLGAKSVCPSVTMDVTFTGSWYNETSEKEAANKLIANGCKLISQHADSMGAPTACEEKGVPNVSYNGSTVSACPNTFIVSSRINWEPYYEYAIKAVNEGKAIDTDWTGTLATGSVVLTEVNTQAAAAGTQEAIDKAKAELEAGTLHVFDTKTFTVEGKALTTYLADVDTDKDNTGDTEAIENGFFNESSKRSAPYFDVEIDGITLLDRNYG